MDTSIWIDYFREVDNPPVNTFITILNKKIPYGITSFIYQEILQGAISQKQFKQLSEYLSTQWFYHPRNSLNSYQAAAELYFNCRNKGYTIRSTIDCLIAQIAIENDLVLLHNDKDFQYLKRVQPALQLAINDSLVVV